MINEITIENNIAHIERIEKLAGLWLDEMSYDELKSYYLEGTIHFLLNLDESDLNNEFIENNI